MLQSAIEFLTSAFEHASGYRGVVDLIVVQIAPERVQGSVTPYRGENRPTAVPALALRLTVLAAPNDNQGHHPLRSLDAVLAFFRDHPLFDERSHPALADHGLVRITVELKDLDLGALGSVWASLRRPAVPAVAYEVRLLATVDRVPPVVGGESLAR